MLQLPRATTVDLRAACFCHQATVDTAYVCSVCLGIFCDVHATCPTCSTTVRNADKDSHGREGAGDLPTRECPAKRPRLTEGGGHGGDFIGR